MDFKVIKGINHYVYDDIKEFRAFKPDEPYIDNWRHANENDWVITDDGYFCQILKVLQVLALNQFDAVRKQ